MTNARSTSRNGSYILQDWIEHVLETIQSLSSKQSIAILSGVVAILLAVFSYLGVTGKTVVSSNSSRKAQQAKAMREAYKAIEKQTSTTRKVASTKDMGASLQISQMWIYPIKSIRGCQVPNAMLTAEGFYLDRRFMLLKDNGEIPRKLQNMHVPSFPSMCLFLTSINDDTLIVTYQPPSGSKNSADSIEIPLEPETFDNLEKIDVIMHQSPTTAFDMGQKYSKWFTERFGFKVVLAFWGGNPRPVLGNRPGKPATQGPKPKTSISNIVSSLPIIGPLLEEDEDNIAFNDCAPYLVISEASVADVTNRLPDGVEMDHTKFRGNIVLKGSNLAFEEDFWGELTFSGDGDDARIILTGNCGRCKSLNVDYNTGDAGKGPDGQVLKLLQKDRRVDPGMKYSPIFGRYGFTLKGDEGKVLRVGDQVAVKRNQERTVFYWPGISTA